MRKTSLFLTIAMSITLGFSYSFVTLENSNSTDLTPAVAMQDQEANPDPISKKEFLQKINILPDALKNLSAVGYDQLDETKRQSLVDLAKAYHLSTTNLAAYEKMELKLDEWVTEHLDSTAQKAYAMAKKTATN